MRVSISCAERFHSYNLAEQLNNHHVLEKLITTYPKSEVIKYNLPSSKINSLLYWEVLKRGWNRFAKLTGINHNVLNPFLNELYDSAAVNSLPENIECFIGWSGRSEKCITKAKSLGAISILERGSSHIQFQTDILKEEYQEFGPKQSGAITHRKVIEKELREYEAADFISVPSGFVKQTFLDKGFSSERIIQNPYGVNIKNFYPGKKEDSVFRLIYVGQMSLRKGVHYLLQAFHTLQLKNAELLLVGSMTEEIAPWLKKYYKDVLFVGPKPQDMLYKYYQSSSVFVICSIEEGLAMVQAQAAACALPVICTTNTGGADLFNNGQEGFIIPIRNVEAICEKIEWMYLHQNETEDMGRKARKRVSEGFTWEDYGNRYFENLKNIIKQKKVITASL